MKFYPAGATEAAQLSEIGTRSYLHHFAKLWHSAEEMNDFIERQFSVSSIKASLQKPDMTWFMIETAEVCVGLCQINWTLPVEEDRPDGAYLNKIYLLPEYTGKGYGEKVFAAVEALCRMKQKKYYWLEVLKDNPGATQFYQRQGFSILREELFTSPTQQSPISVMIKNLENLSG
jgi:ribosomal protein S18 acetylase RimI-like enzyme